MSVILILLLIMPIERHDRLSRRSPVKSITSDVMHFASVIRASHDRARADCD
jgi:hypothetical protein